MTAEWIRSGLDIVLIVLIVIGLIQATRLIWHLAGLRASRAEMERFVKEFNATVLRAEAGIRNLKVAARESGDDLEKLVEKSTAVRDELNFLVASADQLAERLTNSATSASTRTRAEAKPETRKPEMAKAPAPETPATPFATPEAPMAKAAETSKPASVTPIAARREPEPKPSSRAEKELMQALKKLN
jgi:septal ring factor EnvC (AmiA/AmiB activator)